MKSTMEKNHDIEMKMIDRIQRILIALIFMMVFLFGNEIVPMLKSLMFIVP